MAGFLVSVSVDMSRHRPTGTFEFSHEDLGPRTWPVLGATGEAHEIQSAPETQPVEHHSMPYSIDDLLSILGSKHDGNYEGAAEDAIDMLYRLAMVDGGRGAHQTTCEGACREALGTFVCGLDRQVVNKAQLVVLCLNWLKVDVVPALCDLTSQDNQVTRRAKLVHELAARVGALSHTPMRTLLATPGESSSAFSRSALPLLHDSIKEELKFAALVIASTTGTTIAHSSTTDNEATLAAVLATNQELLKEMANMRQKGENLTRVFNQETADLLNELLVLTAANQEFETSFQRLLKEMDIVQEDAEAIKGREREALIEYARMKSVAEAWSNMSIELFGMISAHQVSVTEQGNKLRLQLKNLNADGTRHSQKTIAANAEALFRQYESKMARHTAEINDFIETQRKNAEIGGSLSPKRQTSPKSTTTNTHVGPPSSPMHRLPLFSGKRGMKVDLMGGDPWGNPETGPSTTTRATPAAAATRKLSIRIDAMVRGWCGSVATSDECSVASLARHCFAEASAMSPNIAKQGPTGWLSIIDPRCPVATQFDTLIVHYLNATRRASGNRPGYDKDFRRHASAYRQQLCFFKSVKRGPHNSSCTCSETTGWICIYPGNANPHPVSPPCTKSTLGF